MSSTTTSGAKTAASPSASAPSPRVCTSWPRARARCATLSAASRLSSTTSTRQRAAAAPAASRAAGAVVAAATPATAGRRTTNSEPRPAPSLRASIVPPCSSTSRRASVRPTPRPPWARSRPRSPCANRSKMRGSSSGSMPMPLSRTRDRRRPSLDAQREVDAARRRRCTSPRCVSRLATTCVSRAESPCSQTGSLGQRSRCSVCRRASSSGCAVSTPCAITALRSTGSRCSTILPWLMRATSSSSSISRVICSHLALHHVAGPARASARARRDAAHHLERRCGSAPAGCAARATASPGTRPCAGWPPAVRCSAARRSTISLLQAAVQPRVLERHGRHAAQVRPAPSQAGVVARHAPPAARRAAGHRPAAATAHAACSATGSASRASSASSSCSNSSAGASSSIRCPLAKTALSGSASGARQRVQAGGVQRSGSVAMRRQQVDADDVHTRRLRGVGVAQRQRQRCRRARAHQLQQWAQRRAFLQRAAEHAAGLRQEGRARSLCLGGVARRLRRDSASRCVGLPPHLALHRRTVERRRAPCCAACRARPATGCSRRRPANSRARPASRRHRR